MRRNEAICHDGTTTINHGVNDDVVSRTGGGEAVDMADDDGDKISKEAI